MSNNRSVMNSFLVYMVQILLFVILGSTNISAQVDLFKEALKVVDELNNTLLDMTALSDEEEVEIGKQLDEKISEDLTIVEQNKFNVKKIFKNVAGYVEREKIDYRFSIVKSEDINAFTIAGGKVFINTALLDFIDDKNELAFVIAHEIAHNELKHCIKTVQYAVIASELDPTLGEIVQVAYSVYSLPFSIDKEFEADKLGAELMIKAGYNKKGAISFFEKLEDLEKQYGVDERDALNDFISTHPTAKKRRERIEKL